jgi:hypothetical protein
MTTNKMFCNICSGIVIELPSFLGKPSCVECGLVSEGAVLNGRYIRNLTHYKILYNQGITIPIFELVGDRLQSQVINFHTRSLAKLNDSQPWSLEHSVGEQSLIKDYYYDYISFLKDNTELILPKKPRKREIKQVYGEQRQIVLEYINELVLQDNKL